MEMGLWRLLVCFVPLRTFENLFWIRSASNRNHERGVFPKQNNNNYYVLVLVYVLRGLVIARGLPAHQLTSTPNMPSHPRHAFILSLSDDVTTANWTRHLCLLLALPYWCVSLMRPSVSRTIMYIRRRTWVQWYVQYVDRRSSYLYRYVRHTAVRMNWYPNRTGRYVYLRYRTWHRFEPFWWLCHCVNCARSKTLLATTLPYLIHNSPFGESELSLLTMRFEIAASALLFASTVSSLISSRTRPAR